MSRLDAKWLDFTQRGQVWDHFWQDGPSPVTTQAFSQAQVAIKTNLTQYAQSICYIKVVGVSSVAQSQVDIRATSQGYAQAQSAIKITSNDFAQAQSLIKVQVNTFAQAQAHININVSVFAQAQTYINVPDVVGAFQANAFQNNAFQVDSTSEYGHAQAQVSIKRTYPVHAQAQTKIVYLFSRVAQAQARMTEILRQFAQAQPYIFSPSLGRITQGRAIVVGAGDSVGRVTQGRVIVLGAGTSSARITQGRLIALVSYTTNRPSFAQAAARITSGIIQVHAQAQTYGKIKVGAFSQTQAQIIGLSYGFGQAQCSTKIITNRHAQAEAQIAEEECLDTFILDTFSRTLSGTLDTPDIGPAYDESSPTDYAGASTDGSILTVSGPDPYSYVYGRIPHDPIPNNFIQSIDFKPGISTDATYAELDYATSSAYAFLYESGGDTNLKIKTGTDITTYPAFIVLDDTEWYTFKLKVLGNNFKVKIWKRDSESEPDWMTDDTDSNPELSESDSKQFYSDTGTDNVSQLLDNFTIEIPCVEGVTSNIFAQAQVYVKATNRAFAQSRCSIKATISRHAQAQVLADRGLRYSQAQTDIVRSDQWGWAQAKTTIALKSSKPAQTQVTIKAIGYKYGLAQAQIKGFNDEAFAQANALISSTHKQAYGHAQCRVQRTIAFAQAQCLIKRRFGFAQSQVMIEISRIRLAQSLATIKASNQAFAQASAFILGRYKVSQAQARIKKSGQGYAQGQARVIRTIAFGNAQCFITGGRYLIRYNQYLLPGYAQAESIDSGMNITDHYSVYQDASLSEYIGLENKTITLNMRLTDETYLEAKDQVQLAATILRSKYTDWSKLYIQRSDRHYLAMTRTVRMSQIAENRFVDYVAEFEAKPWLISDNTYTVSGISLITVNRTLDDGGWTPATVTVTGTDVTISGYTATEFTGYISISGAVNSLVVTTQPYTASAGGLNLLPAITNSDYELYIGPGTTYISVSGASTCVITYNNRWYL